MNVKVVTGANAGDEGKGMVAYSLAKEAVSRNEKVLSVLYNGGVQRAHTANGQVVHCTGTGDLVGGTTFYDEHFVVDPIALWLTETKVYIHPMCRVVVPSDVIRNRAAEIARGVNKHGSCGMGIFECVKRNKYSCWKLCVNELKDIFSLYGKVEEMKKTFAHDVNDDIYNTDNFMRAADYVIKNCPMVELHEIISDYDTLIFEGGQGLLLDQTNRGSFPHLTPSSVGSFNIYNTINNLGAESTDVFYVSRSYMTRHGVGPMDTECMKEDINSAIVDATNIPNDWQDALRFGYIDTDKLYRRVKSDFSRYDNAKLNIVFTQLNYTNNRIATGKDKFEEIVAPEFVDGLYLSDQKDIINKVF